jgi:hypothetical protein
VHFGKKIPTNSTAPSAAFPYFKWDFNVGIHSCLRFIWIVVNVPGEIGWKMRLTFPVDLPFQSQITSVRSINTHCLQYLKIIIIVKLNPDIKIPYKILLLFKLLICMGMSQTNSLGLWGLIYFHSRLTASEAPFTRFLSFTILELIFLLLVPDLVGSEDFFFDRDKIGFFRPPASAYFSICFASFVLFLSSS